VAEQTGVDLKVGSWHWPHMAVSVKGLMWKLRGQRRFATSAGFAAPAQGIDARDYATSLAWRMKLCRTASVR